MSELNGNSGGGSIPLRSRTVTHGRNMAGARALLRATGVEREDFGKPIIAVANSYTQFVPGHTHLKPVGEWNTQTIVAIEDHIMVILNGAVIVDTFGPQQVTCQTIAALAAASRICPAAPLTMMRIALATRATVTDRPNGRMRSTRRHAGT